METDKSIPESSPRFFGAFSFPTMPDHQIQLGARVDGDCVKLEVSTAGITLFSAPVESPIQAGKRGPLCLRFELHEGCASLGFAQSVRSRMGDENDIAKRFHVLLQEED